MMLRKIHKLGVAYEKYERNPRRVGWKRFTHSCDHDMQEMEDAEFVVHVLFKTRAPFIR